MFVVLTFCSLTLFYVPQTGGFVPAHTTVCPSIKYYGSFDEILNPVQMSTTTTAATSFTNVRKESAKVKKRNRDIANRKKRTLFDKKNEEKYLAKLLREKDDDVYTDASRYLKYVKNVIAFYMCKYITIYKYYIGTTKKTLTLDNATDVLNEILQSEKLVFVKNREHAFISTQILALIDSFELLNESIASGTYDELSPGAMARLNVGYEVCVRTCR
jgi:hypothetical protein